MDDELILLVLLDFVEWLIEEGHTEEAARLGSAMAQSLGGFIVIRAVPVVNEMDDSIGAPAPCQPIGCDHGMHLPGCYALVDLEEQ